jgi:hypothetical protein
MNNGIINSERLITHTLIIIASFFFIFGEWLTCDLLYFASKTILIQSPTIRCKR